MTINVMLVDDHTLVRDSLRELLEITTNFCIVGEAGNEMEALVLAERLRPDVLLLDYLIPNISCVHIMWWLRQRLPDMRVVILSMYDDETYVSHAVQNGASGYLLKEDIPTHLAPAVVAAAAGKYYFSPGLKTPTGLGGVE